MNGRNHPFAMLSSRLDTFSSQSVFVQPVECAESAEQLLIRSIKTNSAGHCGKTAAG